MNEIYIEKMSFIVCLFFIFSVENGGTVVVLDKNGTRGDPEITGLTL
jgi:hypothetical protein